MDMTMSNPGMELRKIIVLITLVLGHLAAMDAQVTLSVDVKSGWNLVSLPLSVADARKVTVFPTAVSNAFAYMPGSGYVVADTLQHGVGYWMKFSSDQTVAIVGAGTTHDSIPLIHGWNLIGSISYPVPISSIAQSPPDNLGGNFWELYGGNFSLAGTVTPGYGYWVFAQSDGWLTLDGNSCFSRVPPRFADPPPSRFQTIVSATAGNNLTFMLVAADAGNGPVTLQSSVLPAGASMNPPLPATAPGVSSEFSWTPDASDTGMHSIRFSLTDSCGLVSSIVYSFMVQSADNFIVPLTITDALGGSEALTWGNTFDATKCPDSSLGEYQPPPGLGGIDARFTGLPATCPNQGLMLDLRPYSSPDQIDTFRVSFSYVDANRYPIRLSWRNLNAFYTGAVTLTDLGSAAVVDMKAETSYTVPDQSSGPVRIIAVGPFAAPAPYFSPSSRAIDFGPVAVGSSRGVDVNVTNTGNATLNIS